MEKENNKVNSERKDNNRGNRNRKDNRRNEIKNNR